ncbi:hypothetical protein GCM10007913_03670 [Devosia yakushimensis]|uniref:Uncharacterized protein n=1 Tax=Devosia yakushimensis TaxID=470028 RepID=A0ABQ5U9P4_9HYPH|nr:hypothetical protein GCM10007913_03670 [Devosia yakushimensis]
MREGVGELSHKDHTTPTPALPSRGREEKSRKSPACISLPLEGAGSGFPYQKPEYRLA